MRRHQMRGISRDLCIIEEEPISDRDSTIKGSSEREAAK